MEASSLPSPMLQGSIPDLGMGVDQTALLPIMCDSDSTLNCMIPRGFRAESPLMVRRLGREVRRPGDNHHHLVSDQNRGDNTRRGRKMPHNPSGRLSAFGE